MGSADITLPAGLTILPKAAPATGPNIRLDDATLARGGLWTLDDSPAARTLHLRALSAPPTGAAATVTVTIDAQMPCSGTALSYSVVAKQSNDFSSSSQDGNALTIKPSTTNLSTTLQGDCKLRFSSQPSTTERNTQIRADAFQPTSTNYVVVEAVDGRPLATAEPLTWFNGEITLAPSVGTFTEVAQPSSMATNGEGSSTRSRTTRRASTGSTLRRRRAGSANSRSSRSRSSSAPALSATAAARPDRSSARTGQRSR